MDAVRKARAKMFAEGFASIGGKLDRPVYPDSQPPNWEEVLALRIAAIKWAGSGYSNPHFSLGIISAINAEMRAEMGAGSYGPVTMTAQTLVRDYPDYK